MPLLTVEKFKPSAPTAEELVTIYEAANKRHEAYRQMDRQLPIPERVPFWRRRISGPKAVIEQTADGVQRAWLERDPRDPEGPITIMVDELAGSTASAPEPKLALDAAATLYGEFQDLTPSQHVGLMDSAQGTLAAIRLGADRETARATAVAEATATDRFFARVFSLLSS